MSRSAIWPALLVAAAFLAGTSGNAIRDLQTHVATSEKPIFDYRRNGVKIDVRIVPAENGSSRSNGGSEGDEFPSFPFAEVGRCVIDLSLSCVQKRVARFLDLVGQLREITLLGQSVKLVKLKELPLARMDEQRMLAGPSERIDRSIDDFFDMFALRITLPRWNGKKNQIDVMMDDTDIVEGNHWYS